MLFEVKNIRLLLKKGELPMLLSSNSPLIYRSRAFSCQAENSIFLQSGDKVRERLTSLYLSIFLFNMFTAFKAYLLSRCAKTFTSLHCFSGYLLQIVSIGHLFSIERSYLILTKKGPAEISNSYFLKMRAGSRIYLDCKGYLNFISC